MPNRKPQPLRLREVIGQLQKWQSQEGGDVEVKISTIGHDGRRVITPVMLVLGPDERSQDIFLIGKAPKVENNLGYAKGIVHQIVRIDNAQEAGSPE